MAGKEYRLPGRAESYWIATTPPSHYPALSGTQAFDVAILGGGIVGITAALLLKEAGLKVGVIEAGRVVRGATGHTTAKITSQHGLIYDRLVEQFGRERAQQYAAANQAAIEQIADQVHQRDIACDFERKPAYVFAESEEDREAVQREANAARGLGLPASFVEDVPLPFETEGAVRFDDQAQFHPRKYLCALAREIPGDGSAIFEETRAIAIRDGEPVTVETERGTVQATDVIQATHFPFHDQPGQYFRRMHQSRSYVLGVRIDEPFPDGMFINVRAPIHSLRSQAAEGGELILVVGEGHRTGTGGGTTDHYRRLEEWARSIYTVRSIDYRWSAQDTMPVDGVPYIGRLTGDLPHQYVGTGFHKWGMSGGTAAAMILTDMIRGRRNPWEEVFDPSRYRETERKKREKGPAEELPTDPSRLRPGGGAILAIGGRETAVYRDPQGQVHALDPACGHMGCTVAWNDAEKSWDCPCHGSRYTALGEVICGPTVRGLRNREMPGR
ncbi:MAG: FAD-dependent oxidoreductase [Methanomicrobiales archaeon]|nr:FAD-dependent oxidoreductase [Methanomicrobiales archaeon]MDI6875701.1 FAD-dependent oxidoreductase [Methanomicrobiales archaeon]